MTMILTMTAFLIQSTLLVAFGLMIGGVLGRNRAVLRQAVLRMTLIAVLILPVISLLFPKLGVPGLAVYLPDLVQITENVAEVSPYVSEAIPTQSPREILAEPTPVAAFPITEQTHNTVAPAFQPASQPVALAAPQTQTQAAISAADAAEPTVAQSLPLHRVATVLLAIWGLGTLFFVVQMIRSQRRAASLIRAAVAVEPALMSRLATCAEGLGVKKPVRLLQCPFLSSPCLLGIRRPTMLLPDDLPRQERELDAILVHELAHLVRGDIAWLLLARIVTAIAFFQPLLWVLKRKMHQTSEEICDDEVLRFGINSRAYAEQLLEVASKFVPGETLPDCVLTMASRKSRLRMRVERILDSSRVLSVAVSRKTLLCVAAVTVLLTLITGSFSIETRKSSIDANDEQMAVVDEEASNAYFGRILTLTVLDPDGNLAADTKVVVRIDPPPSLWTTQSEQFVEQLRTTEGELIDHGAVLKTDQEGNVPICLPEKPIFYMLCFIEVPHCLPFWAHWGSHGPEQVPAEYVIRLSRGKTVGAIFVNENDEPIKDVLVEAHVKYQHRPEENEKYGIDEKSNLHLGSSKLKTDENGIWRLDCVAPDEQAVFIENFHPDYAPHWVTLPSDEYSVDPNGQPTKKIVLDRGFSVSGTMTDEQGKPINNGMIRAKFYNLERETHTDENGIYCFSPCPSGNIRLYATAEGFAPEVLAIDIDPAGGKEIANVGFQLKPGNTIRVCVVDKAGHPIPNASLYFEQWRRNNGDLEERYGLNLNIMRLDENGTWVWNEAPSDGIAVTVQAVARPGILRDRLVPRGENYAYIYTFPEKQLSIRGAVYDAETFEPITDFTGYFGWCRAEDTSQINWAPDDKFDVRPGGQFSQTKDDSRFADRFPDARFAYAFRIKAPGYKTFESRVLQPEEGYVRMYVPLERDNVPQAETQDISTADSPYFPVDQEDGKKLDALMKAADKDSRSDDEIIETVRNGLLTASEHKLTILRWFGNKYIWGQNPQNLKAVELMREASKQDDFEIYYHAVYFGLSVANDKTPEVLQAMVEVAMKTGDYYNAIGRIRWGCGTQDKAAFLELLKPYLESTDENVRNKAENVQSFFNDPDAWLKKNAEETLETTKKELGPRMGEFKEKLLSGNSETRRKTITEMGNAWLLVDDSFLEALAACAKDPDPRVRRETARTGGQYLIWSAKEQSAGMIQLMATLTKDSDATTQHNAVYFGLSVANDKTPEVLQAMVEVAMKTEGFYTEDFYNAIGRIRWGCGTQDKAAFLELLKPYLESTDENVRNKAENVQLFFNDPDAWLQKASAALRVREQTQDTSQAPQTADEIKAEIKRLTEELDKLEGIDALPVLD